MPSTSTKKWVWPDELQTVTDWLEPSLLTTRFGCTSPGP